MRVRDDPRIQAVPILSAHAPRRRPRRPARPFLGVRPADCRPRRPPRQSRSPTIGRPAAQGRDPGDADEGRAAVVDHGLQGRRRAGRTLDRRLPPPPPPPPLLPMAIWTEGGGHAASRPAHHQRHAGRIGDADRWRPSPASAAKGFRRRRSHGSAPARGQGGTGLGIGHGTLELLRMGTAGSIGAQSGRGRRRVRPFRSRSTCMRQAEKVEVAPRLARRSGIPPAGRRR